jgi:hypothetical protein
MANTFINLPLANGGGGGSVTQGTVPWLEAPNPITPGTANVTTSNQTVVVNCSGYTNSIFTVTGTWVGAFVSVDASTDGGVNWMGIDNVGYGALAQLGTGNGQIITPCAGYTHIRLVAGTWVSGTAVVSYTVSTGNTFVQNFNQVPGAFNYVNLADSEGFPLASTGSGGDVKILSTAPGISNTATVTTTSVGNSSVQILASGGGLGRMSFSIFNSASTPVYVALAATAVASGSSCNIFVAIPGGASYVLDQGIVYSGAISAINPTGTGYVSAIQFT